MGVFFLCSCRHFSKALQGERLGQMKGQLGNAQEVKS